MGVIKTWSKTQEETPIKSPNMKRANNEVAGWARSEDLTLPEWAPLPHSPKRSSLTSGPLQLSGKHLRPFLAKVPTNQSQEILDETLGPQRVLMS